MEFEKRTLALRLTGACKFELAYFAVMFLLLISARIE